MTRSRNRIGGVTSAPRRDADSALRQLENRAAGVPIRVGGDSSLTHETSVYRKLMVHRPAKNPGRRGHSKARFSAHRPRRRGTDVIPSLADGEVDSDVLPPEGGSHGL